MDGLIKHLCRLKGNHAPLEPPRGVEITQRCEVHEEHEDLFLRFFARFVMNAFKIWYIVEPGLPSLPNRHNDQMKMNLPIPAIVRQEYCAMPA